MKSAAPVRRGWVWLQVLKAPTRHAWLAVALVVVLAVSGMGWFQYRQIDRVTQASLRGRDNLIWDFYKLELQLANVQLALRELAAQPTEPALLADLSREYEIFASQVQLLQTLNSGRVMRDHASFSTAWSEARYYIDQTDVYLVSQPLTLTPQVLQTLLQQSRLLRAPLHRLVLDAYLVENQRVSAQLGEIRRFTLYYGLTATVLLLLTLWVGWLVVRNLSLLQRRQQEQSDQLREKKDLAEGIAQAKSRFLSAASHDLRQPAHALGLFVSQLAPLATDAQSRHVLACANAAVLDMQNMLDGLFDLSKLDAPSTQVQIKAFALESLFVQLRSSFGPDAAAKGLRLRVCPTAAWIQSDPVLVHRILLNLVSNAVRYTERGTVLVACRRCGQDGQLRIEVRDSGIGIAAEEHEKIFQEFHQVNNPGRDRAKGMGVGLSIVQRCCRLLGLRVAVRSAPGCGSVFSFTLAAAPSQVLAALSEPAAASATDALHGLAVLLIEDDALGCEAMAGLLQSWGCGVTAVHTADAALAQGRMGRWPDVIVSDFRLPGQQNGVDVISALRTLAGRNLAACIMSGDTDAQVAQQVQQAGLVLLGKPVRPAKLRGLLRNLMRQPSV